MARFSDEPLKTTLSGSERIAATDLSTGDDVGMTPLIITQFAQTAMTVAVGSTQGVVSGPDGDKLSALPTNAQLNTEFAQLGEVSIPIFIGTPGNGVLSIYQHCLDVPWLITRMVVACATGSSAATIQTWANGSTSAHSILGLTNIAVGSTYNVADSSDSAGVATLNYLDQLLISLGSTSGSCVNLRCSIKAIAQTLL
jgi:hypothetical protein